MPYQPGVAIGRALVQTPAKGASSLPEPLGKRGEEYWGQTIDRRAI